MSDEQMRSYTETIKDYMVKQQDKPMTYADRLTYATHMDDLEDRIAQLSERVGEYDNAIVNGDFTWHDASEPPDDSRAVYCIVEDSRGVWIRLGTFQHERWKDTNNFENIGCDKWHELPKSPMQRKRVLKEQP